MAYNPAPMPSRIIVGLSGLLAMTGCVASGPSERFISGKVSGSYADHPFELGVGYATVFRRQGLIALSESASTCNPPDRDHLPTSTTASFVLPDLAVGNYTGVVVEIYYAGAGFDSIGSNEGNIAISSVTDASVAGTIDYVYTPAPAPLYAAKGSFEIVRCAAVPR